MASLKQIFGVQAFTGRKCLACDHRTPYQIYGVCGRVRSHATHVKAWCSYKKSM